MSKLAHSNQETMDEIDHQLSDDGDYRHRDNGPTENSRETPPFITALKNGGTKEEAIFALEMMWEEQCGLRSALEELTSEVAPTTKSENRLTQRLGNALLRARRVLASLDDRS